MKPNQTLKLIGSSLALYFIMTTGAQAQTLQEQLGDLLYNDLQLSEPAGQGCVTCHDPNVGFVDPDNTIMGTPVSEGVVFDRFGNRNSPSAGYAAFNPVFTTKKGVQGGQFWDGRAADLAEQARGPFLNPVEMNNTSRGQVIGKIERGDYEELFKQVCGQDAFATENIDASYVCMSEAIAAFESTDFFSPFMSKFDAVQAGLVNFDTDPKNNEELGFDLFTGRGKCAHCHKAKGGGKSPVLFTDFKYHNIGLPENREIFDLVGTSFTDLGLGGFLNDRKQDGKFKNPHLRNVELTPPYMHNGVLTTLKQVVHFYNTRDVLDVCEPTLGNLDPGFGVTCWAAPEIPDTVDSSFVGDLKLTDAEEDAIVAFMLTLTDGYTVPLP